MAGKESLQSEDKGFAEKTGANVRNVGIAVILASLFPVPALEAFFLPGAGLAASGEIFRRATKKRRK